MQRNSTTDKGCRLLDHPDAIWISYLSHFYRECVHSIVGKYATHFSGKERNRLKRSLIPDSECDFVVE